MSCDLADAIGSAPEPVATFVAVLFAIALLTIVGRALDKVSRSMSDTPEKCEIPDASPFYYLCFLPRLVRWAHKCGYCLTVHGSLRRDFDLVAVPWSDRAVSADELVSGIGPIVGSVAQGPKPMPHGRVAYVFHLGGGPYIDLSVMPRVTP